MSEELTKTKKQIEEEAPFVKPEECPGAVMKWVIKRDEQRDRRDAERDKNMVLLIEKTIDKMFAKYFLKYVTQINTNTILALLGITLGTLSLVIWISHTYS